MKTDRSKKTFEVEERLLPGGDISNKCAADRPSLTGYVHGLGDFSLPFWLPEWDGLSSHVIAIVRPPLAGYSF